MRNLILILSCVLIGLSSCKHEQIKQQNTVEITAENGHLKLCSKITGFRYDWKRQYQGIWYSVGNQRCLTVNGHGIYKCLIWQNEHVQEFIETDVIITQ